MTENGSGFRICVERLGLEVLHGEVVVLDLQSHRYFGMNASGSAAWLLLASHPGATIDHLTTALAEGFGVDEIQVTPDIQALLEELVSSELIEACDPVAAEPSITNAAGPYLPPKLEPYGELDNLILSGE